MFKILNNKFVFKIREFFIYLDFYDILIINNNNLMANTIYPKACAMPQCPAITENKYCDKHKQGKYKRNKTTNEAGYGITWQRLRKIILLDNPLCETCKSKNIIKPATEVHHVIRLSAGGTNERDNLQCLCKPCHSRITKTGVGGIKCLRV